MEPILYIGISQSFFAGLMIGLKRPKQFADHLLSAWLFIIFAEMLLALLKINFSAFPDITGLQFAYGPLMLFYVKALTSEKEIEMNRRFYFHFIPAIVFIVISIFIGDENLNKTENYFNIDNFLVLRLFYAFSFFTSILVYSSLVFKHINNYRKNIQNLFSHDSGKITLTWVLILSITFFVSYFLLFISGGLYIFSDIEIQNNLLNPLVITYIGLTLFSFVFSFFGFRQSAIFNKEKHFLRPEIENHDAKYKRSGLKNDDADKFLTILLDLMKTEKPYLDENLSIQDLANKIEISRHYLTQIINEKLNKNFFTFVNEYRIEEAKQKFSDKKLKNYTILAIAYDSGFNSKSTFNTLFKKYTGLTPSEFRNQIYFDK